MRLFYSFGIRLYSAAVSIAAFFGNKKAVQWRDGRRGQWKGILNLSEEEKKHEWIWMHVSSLGEYEQGLPVLEAIKKNFPKYKILLTFFSPSGYEIKKDKTCADRVAYMPSDTICNAKRLVRAFPLKAAFFVKYDFWFNYIKVLHDNKIPMYYVSMLLRQNQYFFKPYGRWFRKHLTYIDYYFAQDDETAQALRLLGTDKITVTGDTRFDRVYNIAQQPASFPEIEEFINGRKCIVAGSTWKTDEKMLHEFSKTMPDDYCLIIAPHHLNDSHIRQITALLESDYQLYTEINPKNHCKILVLNTIGILSKIYRYARFVHIGGGYDDTIHNTQEAVVYGCPVTFGPIYGMFKEAVDLVKEGGAYSLANQDEMNEMFMRFINDETFLRRTSSICNDFLRRNLGATEKIVKELSSILSIPQNRLPL